MLYSKIDQPDSLHQYAIGARKGKKNPISFIGYARIHMDWSGWGFADSEGRRFAAVHVFDPPSHQWDMPGGTSGDYLTKPFVLFLMGNDDHSYFVRTRTIDEREEFIREMMDNGVTDNHWWLLKFG